VKRERNEKTRGEGKETEKRRERIGRGSDGWKATNAAGVERETKKCMELSMKKKEYFYDKTYRD